MKKPFIFLSDFDGTISRKDFYHLFIEREDMKEVDEELRRRYLKREITSFTYLDWYLQELKLSEQELFQAMNDLPIDPHVQTFVKMVEHYNGDFAVISAGADYYIAPILSRLNLDVPLYANRGEYREGGIAMQFPEDESFHSDMYGIAKEKVVAHLEDRYDIVLYAGDGSGDYRAACDADVRFAKSTLAKKLDDAGVDYIPFDSFADIREYCDANLFPSLQIEEESDQYGSVVEW